MKLATAPRTTAKRAVNATAAPARACPGSRRSEQSCPTDLGLRRRGGLVVIGPEAVHIPHMWGHLRPVLDSSL